MVLKKEITHQIKEILKENPQGLSITDIVKAVNINRNTAGRYLENLLVSGQVEMRRFGMAKIYQLSQRVPLSAVLSLSSELVLQLDSGLRIVFANEPFLSLVGTDSKNLLGKNIEYTPVALVFDEAITGFIENIKEGIAGKEWSGEIALSTNDTILFCRIAPTVFENGRRGVSVIFEDVTQRKRAEMALLESEAKLRSITDNSPDMILLLNPKLEIVFISQTYTLTSDKVCGRLVYDFIPQEFHAAATACFKQVLKTGKPVIYGTEHHFVNGNTLYFESTVGPVFEGDRVSALVINARDITERKRAETALLESEATARALINAPTDSVILMDAHGVILALNETAASRFGKRSDEVVGILADDLLPKEIAQSRRSLITQVLEKKTMVRFEDERDGRWFDTVAYPIVNETGDVTKIAIIARDITYRRNIEKELILNETRFRNLIAAIGDIIWETDAQIRFVYVSPQVETLLGFKPDELIGHTPFEFLPQDAIVANQKMLQSAVESHGKSVIRLSHWMHKDGKEIHFESYVIPKYDSDDSFSGFIGIDHRRE